MTAILGNFVSRIVAALLFVALLPAICIIALAIYVDDPGPILFRQWRVGFGGRDFRIMKFRTMTHCPMAESGSFEPGGSTRTTRVGRYLRSSKLDELPQLINVLRGEMALVGPRPEVRKWVEAFPDEWREVHKLRPGITDPAAIIFRNEEDLLNRADDPEELYRSQILPRKIELYLQYSRSQNVWTDLKILFKTILAIFSR